MQRAKPPRLSSSTLESTREMSLTELCDSILSPGYRSLDFYYLTSSIQTRRAYLCYLISCFDLFECTLFRSSIKKQPIHLFCFLWQNFVITAFSLTTTAVFNPTIVHLIFYSSFSEGNFSSFIWKPSHSRRHAMPLNNKASERYLYLLFWTHIKPRGHPRL